MPDGIYTLKQAADYLGLKPATVKYHVYQSGHLKGERLGARMLVFTKSELDEFAALGLKPGRKVVPNKDDLP